MKHGQRPPQQTPQPIQGSHTVARIVSTEISAFAGPLPPPEILARYEHDVYPGCGRQIVEMAQAQSNHRQSLEKTKLQGDLLAERIGQYCAIAIVLTAMGCGTYLTATGKSTAGLAAILAPIGGLVGVFLVGRIGQARERKAKLKALEEAAAHKQPAKVPT